MNVMHISKRKNHFKNCYLCSQNPGRRYDFEKIRGNLWIFGQIKIFGFCHLRLFGSALYFLASYAADEMFHKS